jgi:hypothetical protein
MIAFDSVTGAVLHEVSVRFPSEVKRSFQVASIDGEFTIESLPIGRHPLVVSAAGHVDREFEVMVGSGNQGTVTVSLDPKAEEPTPEEE